MKWLLVALLSVAAPLTAQTAPVALPCDAKDLAKGVDAYRIVTAQVVYVNCGRTNLLQFDTAAALYLGAGGDRKPVAGVVATVKLFSSEDPWIRIDLAKPGGGAVLEKGQDYELDLAPDGRAAILAAVKGQPAPMHGPFEKLTVSISTKPNATITPSGVSSLGSTFQVYSNLALRPFAQDGPKFFEVGPLKTQIYHKATYRPIGAPVACGATGPCPDPPPAQSNAETFGRAQVTLTTDRLSQPKATLRIEGLLDFFGDTLKIQNDVTLGAVPKSKTDSSWYFKVDHEAGPGSTPGYAIEAKVAPALGGPALGGFTWQPALNMDIGAGSVSGVKVNDTIVPSLGMTQLFRSAGSTTLEAVRVTPAVSLETDREFNHQNLIYDQDFQFFIGQLTSSRLVRAWRRFTELKAKNPDLTFSNDLANWGAGLQPFLGAELGGSVLAQTVQAAKSSSTVRVPTYSVARLRPKIAASAEYKRISLTFTAVPRYLFTTEYTTRQSTDGKTIRLARVSGFRPYGEAGVNIGLDQSGHIALSSTYKLGSEPPTFQYTNTVQTGLLIVY
jgi:hypothetical protein